MVTQVIGIALLAFSLLAKAWKDSPKCTFACFHATSQMSACDRSDFVCRCSDSFLIGQTIRCIQTECSAGESESTIQESKEFCISKGSTFNIPPDVTLVSASSTVPGSATLPTPTTSSSSETFPAKQTQEAVLQDSNGAKSPNVNVIAGILAFGLVALAI